MSNDLISRKALTDEIEKSMNFNPHEDSKIALNHRHEHIHFLSIAEKIPTAYDVDAVCEELENQEKKSEEAWNKYDEESMLGEMKAYKNAIDIVRNGGK